MSAPIQPSVVGDWRDKLVQQGVQLVDPSPWTDDGGATWRLRGDQAGQRWVFEFTLMTCTWVPRRALVA